MRRDTFIVGLVPAVAAVASPFVYAETYLTEEQARDVLFPGESFTDASFTLTEAQRKQIAKESGVRIRSDQVRVLKASGGGWLFFDAVRGQHEYIDFAVALSADGSVKGVEILEYRETYGHEVREPKWRAQFTGKTVESPLELDNDIVNITGATLSSQNVTRGVRRLLHTWNIAVATRQ
ncbi:MAG TPA: FMN-binding protein [Kiritimatiellia bacterium]|jgi:Na+-translocating ferredoxin:NAD+ oxidoreductase RnfG subunit